MASRAGQRRDRRDRNIVPEDFGCGTGAAAMAIENDIIHTDIKRRIDVFLYVLCRQLLADGNTAGAVAHFLGEVFYLAGFGLVREPRR